MKRVLLLDTSVGSLNMGDEIINRSIRANWPELFSSNYVMRMASHTPMHTPLQYALYRRKLDTFKRADIKLRVRVVAPSVSAFGAVLDTGVDYVGNRLHGGIFALQRGCRAIIISIDYRAREMGKDYSLRLVERDAIDTDLAPVIEGSWATAVNGLDFDRIRRWKAQFDVGQ